MSELTKSKSEWRKLYFARQVELFKQYLEIAESNNDKALQVFIMSRYLDFQRKLVDLGDCEVEEQTK